MESSESSGEVQCVQNGDDDLRCWRLKTTAMAAPQGVRRCSTWRGGRGLRRGAFGLVGEARPWWWARQQRAAATAALGHEREREQRRGRSTGRVRERSGWRGVAREAQGNEGEAAGSRRWHGRVPACGEHTPRVLLARGGGRLADGPGGLLQCQAGQVSARYSVSLLLMFFYFSVTSGLY